MQQAPTYADFDRLYAATLESIERWAEVEAEIAKARQDMARDVRAQIAAIGGEV